jgi:hypothetical protein
MSFETVSKAIGADGDRHREFEQGKLIHMYTRDRWRGVCHGHTVNWLIARYDGNDYVGSSHFGERKESTPILAESKTAKLGSISQEFESGKWREHLDSKLRSKSMALALAKKQACKFMGLGGKAKSIADGVLTDSSRYFYLYIKGDAGAHAIGIHRPWILLGKSSTSRLFDPNLGEFVLKNSSGLQAALKAIESHYRNELDKSFELFPYTGNGW